MGIFWSMLILLIFEAKLLAREMLLAEGPVTWFAVVLLILFNKE